MAAKEKPKTDEAAPSKKAEVVLNDDGTPAITDEERQASIDRHQALIRAKAGMEPGA